MNVGLFESIRNILLLSKVTNDGFWKREKINDMYYGKRENYHNELIFFAFNRIDFASLWWSRRKTMANKYEWKFFSNSLFRILERFIYYEYFSFSKWCKCFSVIAKCERIWKRKSSFLMFSVSKVGTAYHIFFSLLSLVLVYL